MATKPAFSIIYDRYYHRIIQYLARIAGPREAEDLAQEVFDKVSRNLDEFKGKSKISTWIYRIATNAAIDRSRSAAAKHAAENIPIADSTEYDAQCGLGDHKPPSTDQLVIQKEMSECINEYVDTLPPEYKTVIILKEQEGLANKEIAEILDISLDNVKIRLHRARAKLKAILNEACEFYYSEDNTLACDRKQIQILPKVPK